MGAYGCELARRGFVQVPWKGELPEREFVGPEWEIRDGGRERVKKRKV